MSYIIVGRKKLQSTPSVGRATIQEICQAVLAIFLSTPSVGRATGKPNTPGVSTQISIHALRGEGDMAEDLKRRSEHDFYPRPPWGGRPQARTCRRQRLVFLSTPSVGRATKPLALLRWQAKISIHALRGEGDISAAGTMQRPFYFYPRPPWGGRPLRAQALEQARAISIHALRGEGDPWKTTRSKPY